jgi:hypothetical protein
MNTALRRAEPRKANGEPQQQARLAAVAKLKPPKSPARKRWGRTAAGVFAGLLGAWVFASLYVSAGHRTEVIVVANPVARYDTIKASDLRVVRVSADPEASSLLATRMNDFVGRVASSDLIPGALLLEGQLLPAGQKLLGTDEVLVGVLLGPGDGQLSLKRGSPVVIVVRPATGETTTATEVTGWVFDSSAEALNSRERPVELALPRAQAGLVSAAAADKRISVLALAE